MSSVEGSDVHTATRFEYAMNGKAVTYAVGETWDGTNPCGTYEITYAREFRYDSGRQRYLNREMDAAEMNENIYSPAPNGETWTDYDGDDRYGGYTMSGSTAVNARSFEPGMATVDPWVSSGSANTSYYHGNQIGSTRMMSDSTGAATGRAAYTAFGERISGTNHRHGYAGAHGYQQHSFDEVSQLDPPQEPDTVFPYMHVGARYYDPATGRFLQRDPIGIGGGSNVYGYVRSGDVGRAPPDGDGSLILVHPRFPGKAARILRKKYSSSRYP